MSTAADLSLVPVTPQNGMLMPLATIQEAQQAIAAYEALKTAIARPDDVQVIQGRKFLKKSFWRRVAACFGLSLELVREERLEIDGKLAYRVTYRAIAPNGRSMDGDGYCSTAESGRGGWPEHNVRATAHTRAKNRAISDLVGGGEVSAEEMPDEDERPRQQTNRNTRQRTIEDVHKRALTLGITEKQWQASVRKYKGNVAFLDDGLNLYERNRDRQAQAATPDASIDAEDDVTFTVDGDDGAVPASLETLPVGTRGM